MEEYYKYLHKNPELSGCEINTQKYIIKQICNKATKYYKINYSVIAYYDKGCELSIGFRSEMDGLPIIENKFHEIHSTNNNMHACGHDIHASALLNLQESILDYSYKANICLIFQSGEEDGAHSLDIVESGILKKLNVKIVYGCHVWPNLSKYNLYSNTNLMYGSVELDIKVHGEKKHISNRNLQTDAIQSAIKLEKKLFKKNNKPYIFHLGKITGGSARNVQSDLVVLNYSFRYQNNSLIDNVIFKIGKKFNNVELQILSIYPPLKVSNELIKKHNIENISTQLSAEDFGYYNLSCDVLYMLFGLGKCSSLHSSDFTTNKEDRLEYFLKIQSILFKYKI